MSNEQLFDVLSEMLNELRDGHVNLVSKIVLPNTESGTTITRAILMTAYKAAIWEGL